jgi:hypothetical protein
MSEAADRIRQALQDQGKGVTREAVAQAEARDPKRPTVRKVQLVTLAADDVVELCNECKLEGTVATLQKGCLAASGGPVVLQVRDVIHLLDAAEKGKG